ncbi:MAG: YkgJ family cysteine cluster protein [Thermodesulfobacteriota bacterium]|nr:YkgJ family cysteine cluster protein [Thermodesulfobacteriota bacterium]
MSQINSTNNKDQIQRMDPEHIFKFNCYKGVSCFTQCCQDVTIVLTPYDVLRLKNALEISSDEFLDRYTIITPREKRLIPLVILKMIEDDKKCPFVSLEGCTIYDNRPWPCRMYPLDMNDDGTLRFITDATKCMGLNEKDEWSIGDWLVDQGIVLYDEMNALFSQITTPLHAQELDIDNPDIAKMIFMALYDLDKFREFVFKSTFLDRFEVDTMKVEKIKRNDTELLRFGIDWIKFGIFGQLLFKVRQVP